MNWTMLIIACFHTIQGPKVCQIRRVGPFESKVVCELLTLHVTARASCVRNDTLT